MQVNESMNIIFEKLEKFFRTETVVGDPIQVGEITLIPIIDISFGAGGGGGAGKDEKGNDGTVAGGRAGAKSSPNSMLVIKGSEVSVFTLKDKNSLERIVEMVPEIIDKVSSKMAEKKEKETEAK